MEALRTNSLQLKILSAFVASNISIEGKETPSNKTGTEARRVHFPATPDLAQEIYYPRDPPITPPEDLSFGRVEGVKWYDRRLGLCSSTLKVIPVDCKDTIADDYIEQMFVSEAVLVFCDSRHFHSKQMQDDLDSIGVFYSVVYHD
jgi:hypothetical protein